MGEWWSMVYISGQLLVLMGSQRPVASIGFNGITAGPVIYKMVKTVCMHYDKWIGIPSQRLAALRLAFIHLFTLVGFLFVLITGGLWTAAGDICKYSKVTMNVDFGCQVVLEIRIAY